MNDELTRKQKRFVTALVTASTVRDAADAAGVCERTAWNYLAEPAIKAELATKQDAILGQAARRLASEMSAALDVLGEIMRNPAASDAARVSAARAVLDSGLRMAELVHLTERVTELERRIGGTDER